MRKQKETKTKAQNAAQTGTGRSKPTAHTSAGPRPRRGRMAAG